MVNRILSLIQDTGMTDAAFCQELSLGNGSIGKWRSGKQKPSLDAVIKIAKYFNVTTDYLIFGDKPPAEDKLPPATPETAQETPQPLTESDILLLETYHSLPPEKQNEFRGELIGYLKALQDLQKKGCQSFIHK